MSATRLLVLGVVRIYGEAHGYQVRRELISWAADAWANVQPGSIYHALKKLAKDGLLEDVGVEGTTTGPERTVYRVTDDGETEFFSLLGRSLSQPGLGQDSLSAAVTFLTTLRRDEAIALLGFRLVALDGQLATARHSVETWPSLGKPAHVTELARRWERAGEMDIRWTKDLVDRLRAGEYVLADDSPESFGSARSPADERR